MGWRLCCHTTANPESRCDPGAAPSAAGLHHLTRCRGSPTSGLVSTSGSGEQHPSYPWWRVDRRKYWGTCPTSKELFRTEVGKAAGIILAKLPFSGQQRTNEKLFCTKSNENNGRSEPEATVPLLFVWVLIGFLFMIPFILPKTDKRSNRPQSKKSSGVLCPFRPMGICLTKNVLQETKQKQKKTETKERKRIVAHMHNVSPRMLKLKDRPQSQTRHEILECVNITCARG